MSEYNRRLQFAEQRETVHFFVSKGLIHIQDMQLLMFMIDSNNAGYADRKDAMKDTMEKMTSNIFFYKLAYDIYNFSVPIYR